MSQQESAAVPAEPMFYSVATLARVTGTDFGSVAAASSARGRRPRIKCRRSAPSVAKTTTSSCSPSSARAR